MEQINTGLTRELELIRERYSKLLDAHQQIQKQNCLLEERILSAVENYSEEKDNFRLAQEQISYLKQTIRELEDEKQRYKNDCNLAVTLLQQNPTEFLSTTSSSQPSSPNVIIPTFPPTTFATGYSLISSTNHHQQQHHSSMHFICSNCHRIIQCSDVGVQTSPISDDHLTSTAIEPHSYITINQYQRRSSTKTSLDAGVSTDGMPQMHTV